MKKRISIILLAVMVLMTLSGCGNSDTASRTENTSPTVNEVLENGMTEETVPESEEESKAEEPAEEEDLQTVSEDTSVYDVDLTQLSATMVYAEVYNMMTEPDGYIGKTVKMEGTFAVYHDDYTGNDYFACIVQDATACCSQGIEFVLTDEYRYPEDYPTEGENVTVSGVFDTYEEFGFYYVTLREAQLLT